MAALFVAANWKDVQYPFTVERINGGIIKQWNIDSWGRTNKTHMDDSQRHNDDQKTLTQEFTLRDSNHMKFKKQAKLTHGKKCHSWFLLKRGSTDQENSLLR